MAVPIVAQRGPYNFTIVAGRTYAWCACGRSKSQPFCDGSHKETAFTPVVFTATDSGEKWFCGCKHSAARPYCDGTHSSLPATDA